MSLKAYSPFFAAMLLLVIFQQSNAQFLRVDGTRIIDADGNEVLWRGIGLGGWMLQEGYMLRTSGPQHEIEAKVLDLIGEDKKEQFYDAWLANHMRKIDVDSMAAWGYNSIRLPMHYKLFTPPVEEEPVPGEITWLDKGFEMTDELLSWCEANNMYLILDLHAAPGGQGENADISDYDPTKPSLWESEANQEKTIALWRKLAERYADEPMIAAYDIINEPNWGFQDHEADPNGCAETENTLLWELQREITEAIREVDQNHIVVIEGNCWGNNYNGLPELWDDNLVVSYHKYWNGNEQSNIRHMLDMRTQRNVPIWLGETGENSNTWFTNCIALLEENNIGWSWWPLKKLGLNNPLQIQMADGYQDILDYWNGNGDKPSEEDAFNALMEYTENLKLENNIYHPDVVDAMIRQPHSEEAIPFANHKIGVEETVVYATDYDLGRNGVAYYDADVTNTTGNAGGAQWNLGGSYRNDGVDIERTTDTDSRSNGYNVGWTETGEWLQYTIDVDSSAVYSLSIRYASQYGAAVRIEMDGKDVTGTVQLPTTTSYQNWSDFEIPELALYEGQHQLRIYIEKEGVNLGFYSFFLTKKLSEIDFKVMSAETDPQGSIVYVNLNKKSNPETVSGASGFSLSVEGETLTPQGTGLQGGDAQQIRLEFDGGFQDGDDLKLSYTGVSILSEGGSVLESFSEIHVRNNLPQHFVVPGKLEAEDYFVNEGLVEENTTDTGGGLNLGYTNAGDYLEYRINVATTGNYKLEVRIACESNAGELLFQQFDFNGTLLNEASLEVPVTGGWQSWQTVSTTMDLDEGRTILRVKIVDPEFNLNWYRFIGGGNVTGIDNGLGLLVSPIPARDYLAINLEQQFFDHNNALTITDLNGREVFTKSRLEKMDFERIALPNLAAGLYILGLDMGNRLWKVKLLIEE